MPKKRDPFLLARIMQMKKDNTKGVLSAEAIAREVGVTTKTVRAYLNTSKAKQIESTVLGGLIGNIGKASSIIDAALTETFDHLDMQQATVGEQLEIMKLKQQQASLALQIIKTLGKEHLAQQPKVTTTQTVVLSNVDRVEKERELKELLAEEMLTINNDTKEISDGTDNNQIEGE